MKLVIAIVQDTEADNVLQKLLENDFSATKLASTGGFLRRGSTTILTGVEDDQVDTVKMLIQSICERRKIQLLAEETGEKVRKPLPGTVVMVLDVAEFHKF